jgi:hypothetical protein
MDLSGTAMPGDSNDASSLSGPSHPVDWQRAPVDPTSTVVLMLRSSLIDPVMSRCLLIASRRHSEGQDAVMDLSDRMVSSGVAGFSVD